MIRVFQCEDTLTGILTGVYDAWDSRLGHEHVRLSTVCDGNLELFCEYVQTEPDTEKAEKVIRTIKRRMGEEAFEMIAYAASYPDDQKADAIYRMIVTGLHLPDGRQITGMLTHSQVRLVFELRRKAWHIAHRYMGFVRFRELENGVLFSEIDGEADVLIFPNIESGNAFYKAVSLFSHADMAGLLQGPSCPVVLPSRSDSGLSKYYSIAMACLTSGVKEP